ncbi:glutathione S-transferase family protein [Aestuariicoccus sp. MJ-SS9]|uniref:glutathione S-transferase family protein n=1 Tax=Aestuariicoccus sp. MJ-SS9 TaxID=3079855 RepID=UPI002906A99B|nr:glutathione S-transferase family protein [Aestuariicoccus sp. MJ-SS9]MDU8914123.1 glutathione S-transferase family protein [Aestuariicoccus sp. MJ-SS9]
MIEVYGRATSSNVQLVMWACGELGLDVTRHDVGHDYGGTDTAAFLSMNPMGKVPVLRDGDLVLFESAAILRYLAARYGDASFWPDPETRAPLDTWAEWVKTSFGPAFLHGLFYPLVRRDPALLTPEVLRSGEAEVAALASMLARRIGDGPWLGGAAFTWADVMCGHLLWRYFELPFKRADLPELKTYYKRLCDRPAFVRHVMVSYEPLRFKET